MSFGKGSGSQSSQGSNYGLTTPVNMQNPAYVGMSPGVSAGLASLYQMGPSGVKMPGAGTTAGSNPQSAWVAPPGYNPGGGAGSSGSMAGASSGGAPGKGGGASGFSPVASGGMVGGAGTPGWNWGGPGDNGAAGGAGNNGFQAAPGAYAPPGGPGGFFSPFAVGGASAKSMRNPLVAQITGPQQASLGGIGAIGQLGNLGPSGANVGQTLSNFMTPGYTGQFTANNPQAASTMTGFMNPNFAANLATSPQTQAAIGAATNPIEQAFRTQAMPQLGGSATGAGQRAGGPGQAGSSAFDQAFNTAQGNEEANIGQVAGGIANQAYQTGIGINANAPAQQMALSGQAEQQQIGAQNAPSQITQSQLNDMVGTLQNQVLPQLTQQYGINQGLQLFNTQIQQMMGALGLGVQASQPALAYNGVNSGQSSSQGSSSNFSFGIPTGSSPGFG